MDAKRNRQIGKPQPDLVNRLLVQLVWMGYNLYLIGKPTNQKNKCIKQLVWYNAAMVQDAQ